MQHARIIGWNTSLHAIGQLHLNGFVSSSLEHLPNCYPYIHQEFELCELSRFLKFFVIVNCWLQNFVVLLAN